MSIILLLLFYPLLIAGYNLQVRDPLIYEELDLNNRPRHTSGFFGYSVLLSSQKENVSDGNTYISWMYVGAPKSKSLYHWHAMPEEPGVAYRCRIPGSCMPINATNPGTEDGIVGPFRIHTFKSHGWFGAAMSLHEPTESLAICAPRTIVDCYRTVRYSMQGTCYIGSLYSENLHLEDKNYRTYNFTQRFRLNPLSGFAVHYPASQAKEQPEPFPPIIGSPKHLGYGTVRKMGHYKPAQLSIDDDDGQFGYALTSGYYFHENQIMVTAGAPGMQYVGQVAIMDPRTEPLTIKMTVSGEEIGEYFGACLTTGDLNNDGLDDLIVGAPHWKNDNGRVHIFLGNKDKFSEAIKLLEGSVEDALFGYAMACGDLDNDGFYDLIIGAPWEASGVIYVYNGNANIQELNSLKPSQRIVGSEISRDIRRFGFSLSNPRDIDNNNFTDLAVGAYASGHAVILRSRPVVQTEITLTTTPEKLFRNSTSLVLKLCINYVLSDTNQNNTWHADIFVTVDEDYERFNPDRLLIRFLVQPGKSCTEKIFELEKNISNYVDAVQIVAKHHNYSQVFNDEQHMHATPIEYKGLDVTARTRLSFDISGIENISHAFLFTELYFEGIRNSTWFIGSDDLRLVLWIENRAEPAYQTTVTFHIPEGIHLAIALPSCQEEKDPQALRVTCDVGDPLKTAMGKNISLDLDMKGMHNGLADGTILEFAVKIKTLSENGGKPTIAIPLLLKANVTVSLSGNADANSYYLTHNEKSANLFFEHTYYVSRSGTTPISDAFLTIQIPYKLHDIQFLAMLRKPQVSMLGRFYECSVTGVPITKSSFIEKSDIEAKIENDFGLDTFVNQSRRRRTTYQVDPTAIPRMDTISHTALTNSTQWEINNNTQPQFYAITESVETTDLTYLNCSTPNVTCGHVTCEIPSLKSTLDVGKLELQLVYNGSKLADGADDMEKVIHITTEASVEIVDPKMRFLVHGAGIIVPVTTVFHHHPNVKNEISIWIILGSILLGLLTLCLISFALWKIGFFKRHKKEQLDNLKKGEDIPMRSDSLQKL